MVNRERTEAGATARLPSVFLSYARADNEDGFVTSVYQALREQGFSVWWDRVSMPSRALTFLQEIGEAISAADRLLLILSPTAVRSEYVRAEWQYALVAEKVVTPVLRAGSMDLLPPELKGTHCEDVRAKRDPGEALQAVVRLARDPPPPLGPAETVPAPPPHYRPRPDELARVAERLALDSPERLAAPPQERALLVYGMGGAGKSVLTATVARSTATRRVFSGGVIWLPAGPEARVLPILQQAARALGEDLGQYANEQDAGLQLRKRLESAAVLLVLDNVWSKTPIEPLRDALGPRCRLLITAREPGLVELGAQPVELGPFSEEEAIAYLADRARAAGRAVTPAMHEVARECGCLPFALALAGAMVAGTSWEMLAERLCAADLSFMQARIPGYPYTNLLRALQVSVDQLRESDDPAMRMALARYLEIAAFRWEASVPEAALVTLWRARAGIDAVAARRALTLLSGRGLLRTEGQSPARRVRLHDLQQDYLWALAQDRPREHTAILDAYAQLAPDAPFASQDDGYYLDHYFYHLEQAQQGERMHAVLAEPAADGGNAWWRTRMAHGQALGFVADVRRAWEHAWRNVSDLYPPDAAAVARTVRYALMTGSARAALGDVPLHFVRRLLAEKIWTAEQARAVLEWVARGGRRLDAFAAVLPYLPAAGQPEAIAEGLRLARDQAEDADRARGLLLMLPYLSGDRRREVLEEALALTGEPARGHLLLEAFRVAPERSDLLDRAIEAAQASSAGFSRKMALLELAAAAPADRIGELVPLISGAGSPEDQAEVLIELAARLPEEHRPPLTSQALALLRDGEDFKGAGVTAVKARARVVRLLPAAERGGVARGVVDELERLKWARHRVAALADVLPFLEGVQRTRAEALACELAATVSASDVADLLNDGGRGAWLARQAPEFLQPLVTILLEVTRKEKESYRRTAAIEALLPFLDRDRLQAVFEQEERRAQLIDDVDERTKCVAALARTLPEPLREPVVAQTLHEILDRPERAPSGTALAALAPLASAAQLDRMEGALARIEEFRRRDAVAAVAAAYARLARWDPMLALLPKLKSALHWQRALDDFPDEVPPETARAMVLAAMSTRDPEIGGAAIARLCAHLHAQERGRFGEIGLQAAETLDAGRERYKLLARLVPALPCEQLDAAAALIPDKEAKARMERDEALVAVAVRHSECGHLAQAVDAAGKLAYGYYLCQAHTRMSPHFPAPVAGTLLDRAETAADQESDYSRVELLVEIARRRAPPHNSRLVDKALAVARGIETSIVFSAEEEKARALACVAPLVDAERRPGVILEAWQNAPKGGAFSGVGVLDTLGPLIAGLEPRRTWERWRAGLERGSRERRPVLEEVAALAALVARLGGEHGVLGVIRAVEEIARWWP